MLSVGSIHEEILKKGLEIANLYYLKSSSYVAYDRVNIYSKNELNDDISSSANFKHQTQPDFSSSESNSDDDDEGFCDEDNDEAKVVQ